MEVDVKPGKYVVAVSGGVDSVCLLNVLSKYTGLELIVAHFDHGIRKDSAKDRAFVEHLATTYKLPFVSAEGHLGPHASEAVAREARYAFLRRILRENDAQAIITAHHQDDLLETAIINLLRGTGRKGLTSLDSKGDILRPLLHVSKKDILKYAKAEELSWREDSTNSEAKYLRNYIRQQIMPRLDEDGRNTLLKLIEGQRTVNVKLDSLLTSQLEPQLEQLKRKWFVSLPHNAACEVMAAWLRHNGVTNFDKAAIERAVLGAKTSRPGKKIVVKNGIFLEVGQSNLALTRPER